MKKRILLVMMALLISLILCACQNNDRPDFETGKGTLEDPFEIKTFDDLFKLNSKTSYYYILRADLYNEDDVVINNSLGDFYGVLNGRSHIIHGIKIKNLDGDTDNTEDVLLAGLFGTMKSGSYIHDLRFQNMDVDIDYNQFGHVGSVVGFMEEDSKLEDIYINGRMSVNISDGHIGGAVGTGEVIENVITDMYLGITSQAFALTVGGVVGYNRLKLHRGSAYGTMLISGGIYPIFDNNYHTIGGVVGKAIGEVSESSNKSKMTVTIDPRNQHMNVNVGGIAGGIDGFIKYCTSYGEITISSHASVYAGGLTGIIYHEAIVTNSIALTPISYEGTSEENVYIGGIAGYTLDRFSARKLYYSQEVGLDKAVGNFNDSELTDVQNHPFDYYLNQPELDYLDDKFDIYKGHYPDLLHRFF